MVAQTGKTWFHGWLAVALFVASIIVAPVMAPVMSQAAGENLLSNPGFEAGDANWEKWGSPVVTTTEKHGGEHSLQVKRNTGGASVSVAVQEGKTYRVGLWVKFAGAGVGSHVIDMDFFGTEQGKETLAFTGSTDWEYQQLLYTPEPGVEYVRFSFWNNTSMDYYIDDAVIRENVDIEDPTTPGAWQTRHEPEALTLTWTGSTDDIGVESYQLSYKRTDAPDWNTVSVPHQKTVTQYTYTLENLDPFSVYAVMLRSQDGAGNTSEAVMGLEATPGPNLLVNGDWETGTTAPWKTTGTVQTVTYDTYSGQYAALLQNYAQIRTKGLKVEANTPYLISYWSRSAAEAPDTFTLKAGFYKGCICQWQPLLANTASEWTRSEQQLRSGAKDKFMQLLAKNSTGADLFLDQMFVGALPELPAELAPYAPSGFQVKGTDGVSAELEWEASTGPFGVREYRISYKKAANTEWDSLKVPYVPGQSLYEFKLEGLSPESLYDIEVRAVSEGTAVSAASTVQATTGTMSPVNPDASEEAAALLDRLYATVGNAVYTGQHNYYEEPTLWYDQAAELTGYYPALWGSDFAYYTGGDFAALRQAMINEAIAKSQAGAMVTLTYHQPRPMDAATAGWESVTADVTEAEMTDIVTPGTALYDQWAAQMDEVAGYLAQLKDAGVPVLWRPYHEMNAEFFWWGARPELFNQLWSNMYDRFTHMHGLDNLIWVWSPNAESSWAYDSAPYYPGHGLVDVLAMDIYNNDYRDTYYNKLVQLSGGRPIAIGENGELPDMEMLREKQPRYVYFMTWSQYLTDKNSLSGIQSVYSDPRARNNGETGSGPYVPPPMDSYIIDDFEQYGGSDSSLRSKWQRNVSGNAATVTLDTYQLNSGTYGLKLDYTVGNPGYAGVYRSMGKEWPGMEGISFWLQPDDSSRQLAVQFHETGGEVWEASYRIEGTAAGLVTIPFTEFVNPGWSSGGNGVMDLGSIKEFGFYVAQGNGSTGSGTLYIDDVKAIKLSVEEE
ncbi:fibronectin type III domain-containing protein [Paenibacillus albidus]|uniref:glycosyl hydrolase n=1 Tax=Paenibacillus albidus TaxID=2041023 RepID=UPI001BE5F92F|nr:glycosyl hydrolase [Paenibacillus albidus]MBT2289767.1 fibronectin type III domain-containing protein [Paenibacillus albidus]